MSNARNLADRAHSLTQDLDTTDSPEFAATTINGNITVTGTVDDRDIATNIPASLGTAGQVLTVNSGATAGEWATLDVVSAASGGTFTGNVDFSGGIDVTGNITVSGTVDGRDIATNIPSSLGTAGQVLTVNSGATAAEWADAGGGGGTVELTASGALANGDLVVVNSDGTVSVVSETAVSQSAGTPVVFESGNTIYSAAVYDANTQKIVIAYTDYDDSEKGKAIVGTVSGSSISFGTAVVFNNAVTSRIAAAYDENAQKVVIAYRDDFAGDTGRAIVGTVSGTSISFGTEVLFESGDTRELSIAYDANAQKVVMAYQDVDDTNNGKAVVGTVSGTSISFGTITTFETGSAYETATTYDASTQKVVIAYRDGSNSNYGTAVVGTVSGTDISFGTPVVFESALTVDTAIAYDASAQKVVIAYRDGGNANDGTAIVGTVSGTSISFGTPVVYSTGTARETSAVYDPDAQKVIIIFKDGDNSDKGIAVAGTVSGTSISFESEIVFEEGSTNQTSAAYDTNQDKVVISYRDSGNTNKGTAAVYTSPSTTTNLTAENYIGISDGAYTDTSTATIQVVGSVDDAQSGLTAGQAYYVQTDGTLNTTADDPSVFAGTAVSATKIIVKG